MIRTSTAMALVAALCAFVATPAAAQSPPPPAIAATLGDMTAELRELRLALDAMRQEIAESRRDAEALRRDLQTARDELGAIRDAPPTTGGAAAQPPGSTPARLDALEQEQELLAAKVQDQEQTKVEAGSKYHVRLSGLLLANAAATRGAVDNIDLPTTSHGRAAGDTGGSISAGVRQSFVDLQVFGPDVGKGRTTGQLSFDFFGGFPLTSDGVTAPFLRLRTATVGVDWGHTAIAAGQETPFFSPRSPTSLASTAYPALSSAGNLWIWTPQLRVEQRVATTSGSTLSVQWGLLDPLTGEVPADEYERTPTAGERSGVPGVATRIGWQTTTPDRPFAVGVGAYRARQNWGFGRVVHSWAATADFDVPIGRWIGVSGEVYRGRSLGGFGGGAAAGVFFTGDPAAPASAVVPVDTTGGWLQLKLQPAARLEFNGAFGEDSPSRARLVALLAAGAIPASAIGRNASGFVNAIYQVRSNLVLSTEYRRLWTVTFADVTHVANHMTVTAGIGF